MDINDLVIKVYFIQKYNNKKHPIAHYLKKMLKIEQNYNIYNKKLLTIIKTFE